MFFHLVISYPKEKIRYEIKHERTKMFIMAFFMAATNKSHELDNYKN